MLSIYLYNFIVCLALGYVRAAPVPGPSVTDPTGKGEPPFVPHHGTRGTVDIVLSSVITLTLCVYTSIHLNITPRKRRCGISTVWIYRFYWVLIGLMAPEVVLFAATMQWRNADELCRSLSALEEGAPPVPTMKQKLLAMPGAILRWIVGIPRRRVDTIREVSDQSTAEVDESETNLKFQGGRKWSDINMVSAFFIVMGGFAYRDPEIIDRQYMALTPRGFVMFAQKGFITPDILDNDAIADRSKADSLGKLLVCIQALWMVVNCIARKASGLPTTLVELNVITHVLVAVTVYILWWKKPLAVASPIFILSTSGNTHRPDAPAITNIGTPNGITAEAPDETTVKVDQPQTLQYDRRMVALSANRELARELYTDASELGPEYPYATIRDRFFKEAKPAPFPEESRFEIRGTPNEDILNSAEVAVIVQQHINHPGFLIISGQTLIIPQYHVGYSLKKRSQQFVTLSTLKLLEVEHSYRKEYMDQHSCSMQQFYDAHQFLYNEVYTDDPINYSVEGSLFWEGRQSGVWESPWWIAMATLLGILYAGAHASAWSSHFPSFLERWMWRASCIVIACSIPLCILSCFISILVDNNAAGFVRQLGIPQRAAGLLIFLANFGFLSIFRVIGFAYFVARLYLPVESFLAIRDLPIDSFRTVPWAEYWPHV